MPGIQSQLLERLTTSLGRCECFTSDRDLRAVFVDTCINQWRDNLPNASSPADRIRLTIDHLSEKFNRSGENALVLLLRVLSNKISPSDASHHELAQLADALAQALAGTIFISYKRHTEPDQTLALHLHKALISTGYQTFIDQTIRTGSEWLIEIDNQIKASDFIIVLLSPTSADSEMVQAEVFRAHEYREIQGHPLILPVRISYEGLLPYAIAAFLSKNQYVVWGDDTDTERVIQEILSAVRGQHQDQVSLDHISISGPVVVSEDGRITNDDEHPAPPLPDFDPRVLNSLTAPGGTIRLSDKFYIERAADSDLKHELQEPGTLTTIRAPRQTGKSSLLVRGLYAARRNGFKTINLDIQFIDSDYLCSADSFLGYLGEFIVRELRLDASVFTDLWRRTDGPQVKLTYLMQDYILPNVDTRLVLALDEVDCLLETHFHSSFFALMRAWYNRVAYDELWERLNIVLVISTEPFLLIQDTSQSPFNVGLKLYLEDFNPVQIHDLNLRHGTPATVNDESNMYTFLGGHPYLTRKAFYTMITKHCNWQQIVNIATSDEGPFRDHLHRYHWLLQSHPDLLDALRQVLHGNQCTDDLAFYRLLRAGLVKGSGNICEYRCELYRRYFENKLL